MTGQRLRILVIMPELYWGGAETQFRMLATGLADRGCDVTALVEQSNGKTDRAVDEAFAARHRDAVDCVRVRGLRSQRSSGRKMLSALFLALQIIPILRRRRPDVAIVYSALGMRMTPLLRLLGVKTIFSERNAGDYGRVSLLRRRPYFKCAHAIVANSIPAAMSLSEHGFDVLTIANGVEVPHDPWPLADQQSRPATVLVPARISPVKNQLAVLRALSQIESPRPLVVLAGAVENASYAEELEAEVSRMGLGESVCFAGAVSDMDTLYRAADLVVLPSFSEGTPNVVLEAMARSRPCLVSDIPNNRRVSLNADLRFSPDRPEDLARCLRRALNLDAAERRAVVSEHLAFVVENYSVERMVAAYHSLALSLAVRSAHP